MPLSNQNPPVAALATPFDSRHFRHTLAQFATGVTVITMARPDGALLGLTATSFNSVSLQPPLVLWSLGTSTTSLPLFTDCPHYVINVLAADQAQLATRFAARMQDRFEGVDYDLSESGQPILRGTVAWFECRNRSRYPEGDHVIFVGEVTHCAFSPKAPLIFHGGEFVSTSAPLVVQAA